MKTVGKIRLEFGVNCPYLVRPIGFFTCILPTIINDVRIQRLAASLCYQFVIDFLYAADKFLFWYLSWVIEPTIVLNLQTQRAFPYFIDISIECIVYGVYIVTYTNDTVIWRIRCIFTYDLPPQITAIDLSVTHFIIGSREFYSPESSGFSSINRLSQSRFPLGAASCRNFLESIILVRIFESNSFYIHSF